MALSRKSLKKRHILFVFKYETQNVSLIILKNKFFVHFLVQFSWIFRRIFLFSSIFWLYNHRKFNQIKQIACNLTSGNFYPLQFLPFCFMLPLDSQRWWYFQTTKKKTETKMWKFNSLQEMKIFTLNFHIEGHFGKFRKCIFVKSGKLCYTKQIL